MQSTVKLLLELVDRSARSGGKETGRMVGDTRREKKRRRRGENRTWWWCIVRGCAS